MTGRVRRLANNGFSISIAGVVISPNRGQHDYRSVNRNTDQTDATNDGIEPQRVLANPQCK